jgi:hypothetical protein
MGFPFAHTLASPNAYLANTRLAEGPYLANTRLATLSSASVSNATSLPLPS